MLKFVQWCKDKNTKNYTENRTTLKNNRKTEFGVVSTCNNIEISWKFFAPS
jgi:hypothetical protein